VALDFGLGTVSATLGADLGLLSDAWAVLIAGVCTAFCSILVWKRTQDAKRRDELRSLLSEALMEILEWKEMPYRIARRFDDDGDTKRTIVEDFHRIQKRLNFFAAWIDAYDEELGTAYRQLLSDVKAQTEPHIQKAWSDGPRGVSFLGSRYLVDTNSQEQRFISVARSRTG
jgi:hypothetical protein